MMFPKLSDDITRHIFAYDGTYKEMYKTIVMDTFENAECRVLKTFLQGYIGFPMMMFDEWLSIRTFEYNRERYYHIEYPTTRMVFHITRIERKPKVQHPTHPENPLTTKNALYKLPMDFVKAIVNSTMQMLEKMKYALTHTIEFNNLMTCMLDTAEYETLLYQLDVHGVYEDEIHEYLFRSLVHHKHKQTYDGEQAMNYDYVEHNDRHYMLMWYEF